MAEKIIVDQEKKKAADAYTYCKELEKGNILFFPEIPFSFPKEELAFLHAQDQRSFKEKEKVQKALRSYSSGLIDFLKEILEPYSSKWILDSASFSPSLDKRKKIRSDQRDFLHLDTYPKRSMNGGRILRFFTNINPKESLKWITSDSFKDLVGRFGGSTGVPFPKDESYSLGARLSRKMKMGLKKLGFQQIARSPYDSFMLGMRHYMKKNEVFQKKSTKDHWEFPPNSCWMVFTDQVSHASLSDKCALEQTLVIPRNALLHPENAPVSILERLTGKSMVN